jgi:hypothetical protein
LIGLLNVGPGQDETERFAGFGRYGAIDVGPFEALVATSRRPLSLLPSAMAKPALLSDAGFVLKPQADGLAGVSIDGGAQRTQQPFF